MYVEVTELSRTEGIIAPLTFNFYLFSVCTWMCFVCVYSCIGVGMCTSASVYRHECVAEAETNQHCSSNLFMEAESLNQTQSLKE